MSDEERIQEAMKIILFAGNARVHCMNALRAIEDENIDLAHVEMKLSNQEIVSAHKIQTNAISEETQGKKTEYSLLFAHAQDTLMTIYSEINITKRLIKIFEKQQKQYTQFEKRLTKLEEERN